MSGYIQVWKQLTTDPRFERLAKKLEPENRELGITLALGCLVQLWLRADSHIRDDDSLALGEHEIDQLVGIEGFTRLMPEDWLQILDADNVRLPDYQIHNGVEARKRARAATRQENFRGKALQVKRIGVTDQTVDKSGVTGETPERYRPNGEASLPSLPIPSLPDPSLLKSDLKVASEEEAAKAREAVRSLADRLRAAP